MKELVRASSTLTRERLFSYLSTEFDDALKAYHLFDTFLRGRNYRPGLLRKLLLAAEDHATSWEIRRLAILMLEHQVLKIPTSDVSEFDYLLTRLGLKSREGPHSSLSVDVLKEGFSTIEVLSFTRQLVRRLKRLRPVHDGIRGSRTKESALLNFIATSRRDCKLTLARYIFKPDEVADEILKHVKTSKGLVDLNPSEPETVSEEDQHAVSRLPQFESRILERLRRDHRAYWVADSTSSELNSLVEYPLTTVVLVIKPPGSDIEFEIKRAGRKGTHPLGAVHARGGEPVPPSHRLDGGSTQWLLRYESKSVSRLSAIYRRVHSTEAPFPVFHSRSSIYDVPVNGNVEDMINYFTNSRVFGREFPRLRAAIGDIVVAFNDEQRSEPFEIPGDVGLTLQFLGHVSPTQAIMSGTSSFRLDRLAAYLSDDGAQNYFGSGINAKHSSEEDRRLADEVLEEVLCLYTPPRVAYRSYGQYLEAAYAIAENRERADDNFLYAMKEIGKFWGTLLALRANTNGESFVPRNVGLRSVWSNGDWRIKVIFMDHDNLNLADETVRNLQSMGAHGGTALDELYIWGVYDGVRHVVGAVDCLQVIYRAGEELLERGKQSLHEAMAEAYATTHRALSTDRALQQFFHRSFVAHLRDWDAIVASYFRSKGSKPFEEWKEQTIKAFVEKGCERNVVLEHTVAVESFHKFLERYAFLYQN